MGNRSKRYMTRTRSVSIDKEGKVIVTRARKIRRNHDPKLREARAYSKFRRKWGKPSRILKAKRLSYAQELEYHGFTKEQAENSADLPASLVTAMNGCAEYEKQYFDWRASTELSRGHYDQHVPSMELKVAIDAAAVDLVCPDGGKLTSEKAEGAERLANEKRRQICRRQYVSCRKGPRRGR